MKIRTREWWVSAKPYDHPKDGYKYINRDGPFFDAVAAAKFVEAKRPPSEFYMVFIYSKSKEIV